MFAGTLIRSGNNAKTIKGDGGVYETAIMYLAPADLAIQYERSKGNIIKGFTLCAMASTAGCIAGCLNTAGRGAFDNVQLARIAKALRYLKDRAQFMADLVKDLEKFVRYCAKRGVIPACRLNGTSDIQWEVAHPCVRNGQRYASIFDAFPEVQFYDYTKIYKRAYRKLPSNYSLVLSYSMANPQYAAAVIKAANDTGANVAIVYRSKEMRDELVNGRDTYVTSGLAQDAGLSRPVIDGDETDMRFLDPKGVIVGLYAKGRAKDDTSGFVVG